MRAVIIALMLALATPAIADRAIGPIVIDDDGGGDVDTYISWYQRLKDSGTPVALRGICQSACGLVLMLPFEQVCVESTASLGFHLASTERGPVPEYTFALFRRYTPLAVQGWLSDKELTRTMIFMTSKEIVDLGVFRPCP